MAGLGTHKTKTDIADAQSPLCYMCGARESQLQFSEMEVVKAHPESLL